MNPNITSSVDPSKLSATITGLLIACSGVILYALRYFFGIALPQNDFVLLASQLGTAIGTLVTLFGLCRKLLVKATAPNSASAPQQ